MSVVFSVNLIFLVQLPRGFYLESILNYSSNQYKMAFFSINISNWNCLKNAIHFFIQKIHYEIVKKESTAKELLRQIHECRHLLHDSHLYKLCLSTFSFNWFFFPLWVIQQAWIPKYFWVLFWCLLRFRLFVRILLWVN